MKIGIITTSIREGRNGIKVANWVLEEALKRNDGATYELVDLKDYNLPIMGLAGDFDAVSNWKNKINELDGLIFVTSEYNHAPSGVFKNALDYLKGELTEKVVAFVGYGGVGGSRSIEQIKLTLSTLSVVTTGISVNFFINTDFINYSKLDPKPFHVDALNSLLDETVRWTKAFIEVRNNR